MKDERPLLIFRKTRVNRYTLPALLGCIEQEGLNRDYQVRLADSLEEIKEKGESGKTVVGFSFMTPQVMQVKEEVESLRKFLGPETILIAGGAQATGDPEGTQRLGFDFVFSGESETTFPAFLRQYLNGKLPSAGIISAEKNSSLFPIYPPYSLEHFFFSPIEITRGCLYNCYFCQTPRIFGCSLRHRKMDILFPQLQKAVFYGYRQCSFISPNAFSYGATERGRLEIAIIEKLLIQCQEAGCERIHFGCFPSEVRPDWVTMEVLQLIKKYCVNNTIVLGAQSGSNSLLHSLNRGHTAEQAETATQLIHQAGFRPHVDFVFGFPGETMEDRKLSLRLMEKMIQEEGAKIHAHTFFPLPQTPFFYQNPTPLDNETKNTLIDWERRKKLDGWWKEQEIMGWKIVEWRDQGLIGRR